MIVKSALQYRKECARTLQLLLNRHHDVEKFQSQMESPDTDSSGRLPSSQPAEIICQCIVCVRERNREMSTLALVSKIFPLDDGTVLTDV